MSYVPDKYLMSKSLLSPRDPGGCMYMHLGGSLQLPPQSTWHTPHFSVQSPSLFKMVLLDKIQDPTPQFPFSCKGHREYMHVSLARGNSGNGDQCQSSNNPLTPPLKEFARLYLPCTFPG